MATLETLSVQFNANGTDKAIKNITMMAQSVRRLADSLKSLESDKLSSFASSMNTIKSSTPTKGQTARMVAFADAVTQLSTAINGANITDFATDFASLGQGAQALGGGSKGAVALANALTQVTTQANSATQAVQQTAQASQNISTAATPAQSSIKGVWVSDLSKVASKVDLIKQKFKGLVVPTKGFKSLEEQANKVAAKYDALMDKIRESLASGEYTGDSAQYKAKAAELTALRQQYDELILKQKELALEGGAIQLNPTVATSLNAFKNGFTQVTNIVKNGLHAALRGVNGQIKSFVGHIKNAASAMKKTATGGVKVTDMAKKLSKELLRVSKMLKLMVTRMALRAVIKEVGNGFKSLALHCETFNQSMSALINGSKKLGYSFAAMVEPLINALAPALIYLINLITRVINALNQLFTALGGGTVWHKAKDFTDSWADSIKDANGSAKKLKKTVLGFDELNQLQDNKNSGGGSGITDMFEDVKIDPKWKEFADWLKDMWKNKDFTGLGTLIGTKLKKFLDSIPWAQIRKTSNDLGKCVATLINGLVEVKGLGESIGSTLAQGINTVFEFFNGFVHKLHWDSIGKFIADTFNGFFKTIDWKLIKDTIKTGMAGLALAIQTFINEFDWNNISKFVINGVETIVIGIKEFFEGIDWHDLGNKIGDQLTKMVKGIPWREVGEALGDILQSAVDFLAGFVEELNVDDAVAAVSELVNGFFDKVDTEELGKTIGTLLQFAADFLIKFWDENGDEVKEQFHLFFTGLWETLDDNLPELLGIALDIGLQIIGEIGRGIWDNKGGMALLATAAIVWGLGSAAKAALGIAVKEAIGQGIGALIAGNVSSGFMASVGTVASAFGLTLTLALGEAATFVTQSEAAKTIAGGIAKLFGADDDTVKKFNEQFSGLKGTFELVKTSVENIGHAIRGEKDEIKLFKDEAEKVTPVMDDLRKKTEDASGAGDVYTNVMNAYNKALNDAKTKGDEANKTFKTHSDVIKEAQSAQEKTTAVFKTHLDVIQENAKKTDTLKTSVQNAAKEMPTLDKAIGDSAKKMQELTKAAETAGDDIVNGLKEPISDANFDTETESLFKSLYGSLENVFGIASPAKNMMPIGDNIILGVDEGMKKAFGDFDKTFTDFYNNHVKTWFTKDKWTFSGLADGLKKTFEDAKNAIKSIWNSIADVLNGDHSVGSSSFSINLPKFARGGFPEDGLFMANHNELVGEFSNGKTAVANNAQILTGIENGVYKAVSAAMANNSSGSSYISNEIVVDGDVFARTITKAVEKQNRRYSPAQG